MDTAEAQRIVSDAVKERGYWDGLTAEQIAARQVAKMVEELDEYGTYVRLPYLFHSRLIVTGQEGRRIFDDPERWQECGYLSVRNGHTEQRRKELADMAVVILNMAQAEAEATGVPFDVIAAAVEKSTADVARGVRSANSSQG